jgi:hypothetical protein
MSSANAAPEEEMVAMVAANNAAFFAVLFLETTFVDLFVVCNYRRNKRNCIVSILFFFFFFFFFARASRKVSATRALRDALTIKSSQREGIRDQKFSQSNPIQSNRIFLSLLLRALNFLRAKKEETKSVCLSRTQRMQRHL